MQKIAGAEIYVPDGVAADVALQRTTHLAIAAHADDLEIFAYHGILNCFEKSDAWFTGVVLTDGRGSPRAGKFFNLSDVEMIEVRKREQKRAADIGKYSSVVFANFTSQHVKENHIEVKQFLRQILQHLAPRVVYLHNLFDKHDSHVASSVLSLEALQSMSRKSTIQSVWGCEVWRDLDWLDDASKVRMAVDGNRNLAKELLAVFESQIAGGKRYDLAVEGRRVANATFFESHHVDQFEQVIHATNLTAVVKENLSIKTYIENLLQKFEQDVKSRVQKVGPSQWK